MQGQGKNSILTHQNKSFTNIIYNFARKIALASWLCAYIDILVDVYYINEILFFLQIFFVYLQAETNSETSRLFRLKKPVTICSPKNQKIAISVKENDT